MPLTLARELLAGVSSYGVALDSAMTVRQVILLCLLCFIKIPPDLQIEPEISRNTKEMSCCAGCNTAFLINQLIHPLMRSVNRLGQFTLRNIHEEMLAGMSSIFYCIVIFTNLLNTSNQVFCEDEQ